MIRGVILLHDTYETKEDFGVWKLWHELSGIYPSFAFPHSHGLGACLIGKALQKGNMPFFQHFKLQPLLVHLLSRMETSIYQKAEEENADLIKTKLYLPTEQGTFSESNTLIRKVSRETRHIQVLLPGPTNLKSFRFDPLEEPAIIELQRVSLTNPEGQKMVVEPKAIQSGSNSSCIDQTYYFWDHDPQWNIELEEPALVQSIEFFLHIEATGDRILDRIQEVIAQEKQHTIKRKQQNQNLLKNVEQLREEVQSSEARLAHINSENERLHIQLTELQSKHNTALHQLERGMDIQKKLTQKMDALKNEYNSLTAAFDSIQKEHNSLQRAHESLQETHQLELKAVEQRIEQTRRANRNAQQSLKRKEEEYKQEFQRANTLQIHYKNLEQQLSDLRQSSSMRIGLGFTFIFRKLYDWFQNQDKQPKLPAPINDQGESPKPLLWASQVGEKLFISAVILTNASTLGMTAQFAEESFFWNQRQVLMTMVR